MKTKYQNDRCPVCGEVFTDLIGEYEFSCPECYTTLKVKYFEIWDHKLRMPGESGFYIDPDDFRPVSNLVLKTL